MKFSILIPHYKVGKATAYAVAQLLKFKGSHELEIIVIDNSNFEGIEYLKPFENDITIVTYPPDRLQSHGVALDYVLRGGYVTSDYFIMVESDSYPTKDNWLDYYEQKIEGGYECVGSLMQLSGGRYLHPCGAMYKTSNWEQANAYATELGREWVYVPNYGHNNGFDCHVMIRRSLVKHALNNPEKYGIQVAKNYEGKSYDEIWNSILYYSPTVGVFHNGMGQSNELLATYGKRNVQMDFTDIAITNNAHVIHRIGMEPGQHFSYWHLLFNKPVFQVPTETKWLPNRVNQQQEYTIMENGFLHEWGVSAYHGCTSEELKDIIDFKKNRVEELYNSLPQTQKI